jgi:DNA-binding beta-propeller fold protein YncE
MEVSTLAGDGTIARIDGPGATAQFNDPRGVAVDAEGNVYVTDNRSIRKITPDGVVSTLMPTLGTIPSGIAVDPAGNLYVADESGIGNRIYKLIPERNAP